MVISVDKSQLSGMEKPLWLDFFFVLIPSLCLRVHPSHNLSFVYSENINTNPLEITRNIFQIIIPIQISSQQIHHPKCSRHQVCHPKTRYAIPMRKQQPKQGGIKKLQKWGMPKTCQIFQAYMVQCSLCTVATFNDILQQYIAESKLTERTIWPNRM